MDGRKKGNARIATGRRNSCQSINSAKQDVSRAAQDVLWEWGEGSQDNNATFVESEYPFPTRLRHPPSLKLWRTKGYAWLRDSGIRNIAGTG